MQVIDNGNGTLTVRISRGPEGYDGTGTFASSGGLYSEETIPEDDFKVAVSSKNYITRTVPTPLRSGLAELVARDPGLRDLTALGDSEAPHSPAIDKSAPKIFQQIDAAAGEIAANQPDPTPAEPSQADIDQVTATGGTEADLKSKTPA